MIGFSGLGKSLVVSRLDNREIGCRDLVSLDVS